MKKALIAAVALPLFLAACSGKKTLFKPLSADQTGIHFNNRITETDSLNPEDNLNLYNGGGVGVGDFNRDGLPDLYFSGNQVPNRLYLNKGKCSFEDITEAAGVDGEKMWSKGVSIVDINNDGWPDIYVSTSIYLQAARRRNLLYVNQGNDAKGIPHFKEMAQEYGLDDTTHSTMAAFFDYDNDGDLDVIIAVNETNKKVNPNFFKPVIVDGSAPSTPRLYRNEWSDSLHHPVFTNVSKQAGIQQEGYGHGVVVSDFNRDGLIDIFLTNDFLSQDILYINNGNGTFSNRTNEYFKHSAASAMGVDAEDINNDGLVDLFDLDMNPEDNYRKKTMMGGVNYQTYRLSDQFGYQYQYTRNMLFLNRGTRPAQGDTTGMPVFTDIGFYAGIAQTDWSWSPMIVDFDDDGWRDVLITNGYPKDVTDHDFMLFRDKSTDLIHKEDLLKQIPEVKLNSYAYRNNRDLTFTDVSKDWGFNTFGYANGAVYADLDNDGDMDIVVNKINDEAAVFQNQSQEVNRDQAHYLNMEMHGDTLNRDGFGAFISIFSGGSQQVYENTPYRGYLSSIQTKPHFGLGNKTKIDSLHVEWPGGKEQWLFNIKADQTLTLSIFNAKPKKDSFYRKEPVPLFTDVTRASGISFVHHERDFIDFNVQKMLPHKLSEYGPSVAVGDLDGDGRADFVTGGPAFFSAQIFMQQPDGTFRQHPLIQSGDTARKLADDEAVLLFDADGDGDLDLYIAMGSVEAPRNSISYQDQLYLNDGHGILTLQPDAVPNNFTSKMCVRAADFDHDGDLDLFVSGRVDPANYPKPVNSYIYRNDSKDGKIKFTDVTMNVAKDLMNAGMICDALWTDFDNDGWVDLVLAGEFMPVTFLRNDHGHFTNRTAGSGVANIKGWWNSLVAGDFDNDGDIDYVAGNLGLNSFFKASPDYPTRVYGLDFDNNGIYDMIPSLYLKDKDGILKEFPAEGRDDMLKQITAFRRRFPTYKQYAVATMDDILTPPGRSSALMLEANEFRTGYFRNDGNGHFHFSPLPAEAQFSVINAMVVDDVDEDGNLDLILNGNDYGTEPVAGRYDALDGLVLTGDGAGGFTAMDMRKSGIYIPGNGKALAQIAGVRGTPLLLATQNRGPVKLFALDHKAPLESWPEGAWAMNLTLANGKKRRQEPYIGSSFLSQSAAYFRRPVVVKSVSVQDNHAHWTDLPARGNK